MDKELETTGSRDLSHAVPQKFLWAHDLLISIPWNVIYEETSMSPQNAAFHSRSLLPRMIQKQPPPMSHALWSLWATASMPGHVWYYGLNNPKKATSASRTLPFSDINLKAQCTTSPPRLMHHSINDCFITNCFFQPALPILTICFDPLTAVKAPFGCHHLFRLFGRPPVSLSFRSFTSATPVSMLMREILFCCAKDNWPIKGC